MSEKNGEKAKEIVKKFRENERVHTDEWDETRYLEQRIKQGFDQKDRDHEALIGVLVVTLETLIKAQDERLQLKYSATGRPEIGSWLWDEARTALSHPLVQEYLKRSGK